MDIAVPVALGTQLGNEAISSLANAATSMFVAAQEARARIAEAELRLAEGITSGLIGQTGPVLTTLDRTWLQSTFPNDGGGETKLDISMHTVIGMMTAMDAWSRRDIDPQPWRELSGSYIATFGIVPQISERAMTMAEEAADDVTGGGGGDGTYNIRAKDMAIGAVVPGYHIYKTWENKGRVKLNLRDWF